MVSKARLDLPEPERPVTTMSLSRGISTVTFLRLWTRAPWTVTVERGAFVGAGFGIVWIWLSLKYRLRVFLCRRFDGTLALNLSSTDHAFAGLIGNHNEFGRVRPNE